MKIISTNAGHFVLTDHLGATMAELVYTGEDRTEAEIKAEKTIVIRQQATGLWTTHWPGSAQNRALSVLTMGPGGRITLDFSSRRKKYKLTRTGGYKARLGLFGKDGEERMALLPQINWRKKCHEYIVQLNGEYDGECSSFLILQAAHCANCFLNMLNGAAPALVNI